MRLVFILSFVFAVAGWTNFAKADPLSCNADDKICYLKNLCPQADSAQYQTTPNTWKITVTSPESSNALDFVKALDTVAEYNYFYHATGYSRAMNADGTVSRSFFVWFEETYYRNSLSVLTQEQAEQLKKYSLDSFFTRLLENEEVKIMCSRTPFFGGHTASN